MAWRAWLSVCLTVGCGLIGVRLFAFAEDDKTEMPATQKEYSGKTDKPKESPKPQESPPKPEEEPKPADTPKPQQPAPNPLRNLLQRLIPPPAVAPPPQRNGKTFDPNARDQIDARAPKDRKQADLLRKASAAIDNQEWSSALELLQVILEQDEDSVERFDNEGWLSLRERATALMLKVPEEVARAFRQRWSVEARRRLDQAEQAGRADQIAKIATKFILTDPGQVAADRMGTRHLDRGETALAARWFRLLGEAHAPLTKTRSWQIKAALAAKLAGQNELAERWRKGDGSHPEAEQIEIAGTKVRVNDWWKSLKPRSSEPLALTEWPMFFGAASRAGTFAGGEPLLLPRWQQPLTQIQPLQRQIEMLVEDFHDANRSTLTVTQPLLVDGLVAVRTLGGVQVFDLEQGRPRWSSAERWPAETLIGPGNNTMGGPAANVVINRRWGGARINARFNVNFDFSQQEFAQQPLAQLLFVNGNFGQLSSDGRQLFVVEDDTFVMQGGGAWNGETDLSRSDPLRRSWSSNKLVSYDLRSGRPLWTVGGVESDEAMQPDLPGVFFFGAPTPDGDDLFIVGERDGEVRLYCLQVTTGKRLWSQLLAMAELSIARDPVRRSFTAQVAVADGMVVCPTTVGWLVAVDRASHQLLWVHRYSRPQTASVRRMPNQSLTVQLPWGQRWFPSAPVIAEDAVVFTPQEILESENNRANLVCVGLHDGARRWTMLKENWLALNGVTDGKVLLLGQHELGAFALKDGGQKWKLPIATDDGVPSGLGCLAGDRWHVPLSSGQLSTVSPKTGLQTSRQWSAPGTRLGTLGLYRGSLISAHAAGLSCFEQRESIAAQIRHRRERDSADPLALLTEASMLQLERKSDAAWNVLKTVRQESVPAELLPRYRDTRRDVLTAVIESRPSEHSAELRELERGIVTPEDRLLWQRLKVAELRGRDEYSAAFNLLAEMSRGDIGRTLSLSDSPRTHQGADALRSSGSARSVRVSAWLAGQFAELWSVLPAEVRPVLNRQFTSEVERLTASEGRPSADASAESRRQAVALFGFHPATRSLKWREIDDWVKEGNFSRAELALFRFTETDDTRDVARAWQQLVKLFQTRGLRDDAVLAAQRLKRLGDVALSGETPSGDTTAAKWVEEEITKGRLGAETSSLPDWGKLAFRLERTVGSLNQLQQVQECVLPDARWPFFTNERFQYQTVHQPVMTQRLLVTGLNDNQLDWSLPLRHKPVANLGAGLAFRTVGHQMLVFHGEVLHMVSPVDHRVAWTRSMETRSTSGFNTEPFNRPAPFPMQNGDEFLNRSVDPADEALRNGLLTLCTSEFVAYRGRRVLKVVDVATGEWRWELQDVPSDSRFVATQDLIYLSSTKWPNGLLLRASDGQEVPLDETLRANFDQAKRVLGADLLRISRVRQLGENRVVVERWSPQRRAAVWSQSFAITDQFTWLDSQTLMALSADHKLNLLDLDTGDRRLLGALNAADLNGKNDRYAVADRDNVYVILSGERSESYGDDFMSITANGTIAAFDRRAGGKLWQQKVEKQSLVLHQFAASPVLLFSARRAEQNPRFQTQFSHLLLLDKKTGNKLFDNTFPNLIGNYRGINLNLAERQWELLTYYDRIRVVGEVPPVGD